MVCANSLIALLCIVHGNQVLKQVAILCQAYDNSYEKTVADMSLENVTERYTVVESVSIGDVFRRLAFFVENKLDI